MARQIENVDGAQPVKPIFELIDGNIFQSAVREVTFKPGNLVHGVRYLTRANWKQLLTTGIQAPLHTHTESYTDNQICFAMLSENNLHDRYVYGSHFAPKPGDEYNHENVLTIGIIVDSQNVLKAFPHQTFAVGQAFTTQYSEGQSHRLANNMMGKKFTVDVASKTVYGIPLDISSDFYEVAPESQRYVKEVRFPRWDDEVKVVFPAYTAPDWVKQKYQTQGGVSPLTWRGLVVPNEETLQTLLKWTTEDNLVDKIPPLLGVYNREISKVSMAFTSLRNKK